MSYKKIVSGTLVCFLLSSGVSVSAMLSPAQEKNMFFEACEKGDIQAISRFIERGMNINSRDNHGSTPLHKACQKGDVNLVRYLLELGADPYAPSNKGFSPAQIALSSGHQDIADYIIGSLKPETQPPVENLAVVDVVQQGPISRQEPIANVQNMPAVIKSTPQVTQVPVVVQPTVKSVQKVKVVAPSVQSKAQQVQPKKKSRQKKEKKQKKNAKAVQPVAVEPQYSGAGQEVSNKTNGVEIIRTDSAIYIIEPSDKPYHYTETVLFKDCKGCVPFGIYYQSPQGLTQVNGTLTNNAGVSMYNPLSNLTYPDRVLGKMVDMRHGFSSLVESEGALWARIVIKNPANSPQKIYETKNFDVLITMPGEINEIDYSTGKTVIKNHLTGVFEFAVRKNLYAPRGVCTHRFFAPRSKSTVGASNFGAAARNN